MAKVFELCACHAEGISILQHHLDAIVDLCDIFMKDSNDLILVRYPAATVLLDLTANEQCIEKVAQLIMQKNLVFVVLKELHIALERKIPKTCPNRVYYHRYRDLMMGIILNVTCNVESDLVT